jgi:hypothetical protein
MTTVSPYSGTYARRDEPGGNAKQPIMVKKFIATLAAALASIAVPAFAAADGETTPFIPPANWQPLPSSLLPHSLATWTSGQSAFNIQTVAVPISDANLKAILDLQASTLGKTVSSSTDPICGKPAAQETIELKSAPQTLSQQVESSDGATYILTYAHPTATSDPAIDSVMKQFCGASSVAALAPPAGWVANGARLVGIWVGTTPSQNITLLSRSTDGNAEALAKDAARTAFKGSDVAIVSNTKGTLCGNPATFFAAKANPTGVGEVNIHMELTQSPTIAYILIYSHLSSTPDDGDALSSLSTLCASTSTSK